jgi:hypothetical protein
MLFSNAERPRTQLSTFWNAKGMFSWIYYIETNISFFLFFLFFLLISTIQQTPAIFRVIVQWIGNPVILVGVILLLVFGVILLKEELVQNRVLFQARYNMFTAYCLLTLNDERQNEKIKCLSKQVSSIS